MARSEANEVLNSVPTTVLYANAAAVDAGEIINIAGIGAAVALAAYGANVEGVYQFRGVVQVPLNTGVTANQGNKLYWDASANKAILSSGAVAADDFYLGQALQNGTAKAGFVKVDLNADYADAESTGDLTISNVAASADCYDIQFKKSRAGAIVQSGDDIGHIDFMGYNGTSYDIAAQIMAEVPAAPGASTDMPGSIVLKACADSSATLTTAATFTGSAITLALATTFSAGAIFGATTTGILISGATTTGISITGNATTAISVGTGTFATGLAIAGTLTTGISIGASTTAIKITGAQTQIFDFTSATTAVLEDDKAFADKAGSIKILMPSGGAAYINVYDGSAS